MKKKLIKLTESDVHNIIMNVLTEAYNEKEKLKRKLYKIVKPFCGPKFDDNDWSGFRSLIQAIEDAGYDVSYWTKDGGYRNSDGGNTLWPHNPGTSYWKEYFIRVESEGVEVNGHITCSFRGTMEDPYSKYEIVVIFY